MVKLIEAEGIALNGKDSAPIIVDYSQSFFKRRKAIIKEIKRRELIRYTMMDINKNSKIRVKKRKRRQFAVKFKDNAVSGLIGGTFKATAIFIFGILIGQ